VYLSQDPIGLNSGEPNFYTYVKDPNVLVDLFGFSCKKVPNSAKAVRDYVNDNGGPGTARLPSPPFSPRGTGRQFQNRPNRTTGKRSLPTHDSSGKPITYTEYDVKIDPHMRGATNRGGHRVVMGSDGKNYYTNNHYEKFTEF
jgi:guanyl-specific ribonuclease Sa